MSTAPGPEVRNVAASKQEALRGLLNSLVPNGQTSLPDDADVDKLAAKLDELLASKGGLEAYSTIPRDDHGRPLNEEGLPIIEIVEPVTNESSAIRSPQVDVALPSVSVPAPLETPLSPLPNWALSPAALAARRRERDRILDILEREEAEELAREAAASEPTGRNEKVPLAAPTTPPRTLDEVIRSPAANSGSPTPTPDRTSLLPTKPNNEGSLPLSGRSDTVAPQGTSATRKPKKQKSVSFADPPPADSDDQPLSEPKLDWGDVIPVPLKSNKPGPAKGHGVMKDLVVERPFTQPSASTGRMADSDDEDEDEELNQVHDMPEDEDSEPEVPREALGQLETSDDESDGEGAAATADVDDTDIDEAMLQREIALAYYARRNQMGSDVTSGPLFDPAAMDGMRNDEAADGTDADNTQSNTTRFRRSRLPGDSQTLINSAVQFGRLVNGELVVDEIADREVDASIDALTGGGNNGQEDMTEKTIELLRHGGSWPSDNPRTVDPKPTQDIPRREVPLSTIPGSQAPVPKSGSTHPAAKQVSPALQSKPKSRAVALTPSPSQQPAPAPASAPASQFTQPMIIESGFGFDPAFQIAPPKPKPSTQKPVAPMSETVKERDPAPSPPPGAMRGRGGSRFAQTRRSNQQSGSQPPATAAPPSPMGRDVMERTTKSTSGTRADDPPKRISRFRAERGGFL